VINFVLGTRSTCLNLEPNLEDENWDMVVCSDSN
jgi:hypothetical protein